MESIVCLSASRFDFLAKRSMVGHVARSPGSRLGRGLEHDRHGSVVHELDRHVRTEDAGLDRHAERPERRAEALDERLRLLRRRRSREARSVPLRAVGEERELADDERGAALVEQREVEPPVVRRKDPEPGDLSRQPLGVALESPGATPSRTSRPAPISPRTAPSTRTEARLTRWTTAFTRRPYSGSESSSGRDGSRSMIRSAYCSLLGLIELASL